MRASAAAATARAVAVSATSSKSARVGIGRGGAASSSQRQVAAGPSPSRTTDAYRVIARCRSLAVKRVALRRILRLRHRRPRRHGHASAAALPGPAADHQTLEQAVGRQPVGAVHAGARHLAGGEQTGQLGAAVHVGDHTAAAVVRTGHDRNRLARRIDARRAAGRGDGREPLLEAARCRARRGRRTRHRSRAAARRWPRPPRRAGRGRPSGARPRSPNRPRASTQHRALTAHRLGDQRPTAARRGRRTAWSGGTG